MARFCPSWAVLLCWVVWVVPEDCSVPAVPERGLLELVGLGPEAGLPGQALGADLRQATSVAAF